VDRRTILIISDEAEFEVAAKSHWRDGKLSFIARNSASCGQNEAFDLAIVGGVQPDGVESLLRRVAASGKPAIHVSKSNPASISKEILNLPQVEGWAETLPVVAGLALELQKVKTALAAGEQSRSQLEQQAALGRYMIEARHNFNNALTSVLGNSDLLMMEAESFDPNLHAQVETIRNMAMRMNEIMQRFSSLQKEMQLVEQQVWKKKAKSAGA
jgi:signal transduction histidine kinase